jgi:hypothetical protein
MPSKNKKLHRLTSNWSTNGIGLFELQKRREALQQYFALDMDSYSDATSHFSLQTQNKQLAFLSQFKSNYLRYWRLARGKK